MALFGEFTDSVDHILDLGVLSLGSHRVETYCQVLIRNCYYQDVV